MLFAHVACIDALSDSDVICCGVHLSWLHNGAVAKTSNTSTLHTPEDAYACSSMYLHAE